MFKLEGYFARVKHDTPALREAWNNFTDALHRMGRITDKQYNTWDNPF